jgi:hypothetical protein
VIKSNLILRRNVSNISILRAADRREAFVLVVFVSEHEAPCNTMNSSLSVTTSEALRWDCVEGRGYDSTLDADRRRNDHALVGTRLNCACPSS